MCLVPATPDADVHHQRHGEFLLPHGRYNSLRQDIAAVHTEMHIQQVENQGLYKIAALAAGGAIQAAQIGLFEPCFGLIRPPGHHASVASAWGFCYFNNMAMALEALRRQNKIKRACVLDIDLHFGDGTVNILEKRNWATVINIEGFNRSAYLKEVETAMKNCQADLIGNLTRGQPHHAEELIPGTMFDQGIGETETEQALSGARDPDQRRQIEELLRQVD